MSAAWPVEPAAVWCDCFERCGGIAAGVLDRPGSDPVPVCVACSQVIPWGWHWTPWGDGKAAEDRSDGRDSAAGVIDRALWCVGSGDLRGDAVSDHLAAFLAEVERSAGGAR